MNASTIVIDVIQIPGIGPFILLTEEQVSWEVARFRGTEGGDAAADAVVAKWDALRSKYGEFAVRTEYPFKRATQGGKAEAQDAATTWDGMTPRVNAPRMWARLAADCIGMPMKEFNELDAEIAQTIIGQVMQLSQVSDDKLVFFASSPTG